MRLAHSYANHGIKIHKKKAVPKRHHQFMLFISGGKLSYHRDSANCCIAAIYKIAFLICIQRMPVGLFFCAEEKLFGC
jgi:hypothetical protein